MSLCRKTKTNAPLTYEVLNKDVTKSEILPHSPATKYGYPQKKGGLAGVFSIHSLQVESIFPAAHDEEKVKRTSLCIICSYVKMDVFMPKREKNDLPVHLSTCPLVNWLTCLLVNSSTA